MGKEKKSQNNKQGKQANKPKPTHETNKKIKQQANQREKTQPENCLRIIYRLETDRRFLSCFQARFQPGTPTLSLLEKHFPLTQRPSDSLLRLLRHNTEKKNNKRKNRKIRKKKKQSFPRLSSQGAILKNKGNSLPSPQAAPLSEPPRVAFLLSLRALFRIKRH